MKTGPELGAALAQAMESKRVTQQQVADEFDITQPSVSEWIKFGRIAKKHLTHLVEYFSDVVGAEHWGLPASWCGPAEALLPLRDGETDLLAAYRLLDPEAQHDVRAHLEQLVLAKHGPTLNLMQRLNLVKRADDERVATLPAAPAHAGHPAKRSRKPSAEFPR